MTQQSEGGEDATSVPTLKPRVTLSAELRERRRSSISLAIPAGANPLAASVEIKQDQVEFEAHGVKINRDGLFIEGVNVSEIHQDDLRILRELGRGACSVVKQAQHVETRLLYAVKVFSAFDKNKRAQLLKEVETLWGMECPSLISFVGGYLKDGSIHIILEYMDRGSLTDLIHTWSGVEYGEELMSAVLFQMLWGLGYLHYEHHMHRDVKPQNVLLNSNGEVKLSDFGIARELEGEMDLAQTMVGTIRYMSPERLAGAGYGVAADVWSLGLVLLEMAARSLPFDSTVTQIELHDMLEEDLVVDELVAMVPGHSAQFEEVLRGCLQPHPELRLRPEELLELDWFRQFRRPAGEEQEQEQEQEQEDDAAVAVAAGEGGEGVGQSGATVSGDAVIVPGQGEAAGGGEAGGGGGGGGEVLGDGGAHLASKIADRIGFESGEEVGAGLETCEISDGDNEGGDGSEQHNRSDLDRAAQVVHDFIQRAVEAGALEAPETGASRPGGRKTNEHGMQDSYGNGMIQTMCSDGSVSDSDTDTVEGGKRDFETDFDVDFLAFPDFEQKQSQDAQKRADAALL